MTEKNGKQRSVEAGAANLARHNKAVAKGEVSPGALKHGAYSRQIRLVYADGRTRKAKHLKAIMGELVADLGGAQELTAAQNLLLGNIRSKMIVLLEISRHMEEQTKIVDEKGELLPCLGRNFTTYSESLRRDLEALFSIKRKKVPMSYGKALEALQGGKS